MTIMIKIELLEFGDFNTPHLSIFRRDGANRQIPISSISPDNPICNVAITDDTMIGIMVNSPVTKKSHDLPS